MEKDLKLLLPRDKHDIQNVNALIKIGLPAIEPILSMLLEWLEDMNWPVAPLIANYFAAHGSGVLVHIKQSLALGSNQRNYNILHSIVSEWDTRLINELKPELEKMVSLSDGTGIDFAAIEILAKHNISDREWLMKWPRLKQLSLESQLALSKVIQKLLQDG